MKEALPLQGKKYFGYFFRGLKPTAVYHHHFVVNALIICSFIFFIRVPSVQAYETVVGDAVVILHQNIKVLSVRQAIRVTENASQFVSLDDFGNTVFAFSFIKDSKSKDFLMLESGSGTKKLKSSKTKKLLKMDLSQSELADTLRFKQICYRSKKIKAEYSDFKTLGGLKYPYSIKISSGKNSLEIRWQKVDELK